MSDSFGVGSPTQLDRVAEAICGATSSGQMFPWESLSEADRGAWRRMAQAALDAVGHPGGES